MYLANRCDFQGALEIAERLSTAPHRGGLALVRARLLLQLHRDAKVVLELLSSQPSDRDVELLRGLALGSLGQLLAATRALERARFLGTDADIVAGAEGFGARAGW